MKAPFFGLFPLRITKLSDSFRKCSNKSSLLLFAIRINNGIKLYVDWIRTTLHNGHKALIDFALNHCDQLYVVCASDYEDISVARRCAWLSETYQVDDRVMVVPFSYSEDDLPNTSESSREVSRIWSER